MDLENPGPGDLAPICQSFHTLPIPWVNAEDISNAVLFLAFGKAREPATSPVSPCPWTREAA